MNSAKTISITGAAGQIGYALLFQIASGALFVPLLPFDFVLSSLNERFPALEGIRMELEDCAFPLLEEVVTTSDLATGFSGADWAILVGSVPRKAGMERKDLLEINGKIFIEQEKQFKKMPIPMFVCWWSEIPVTQIVLLLGHMLTIFQNVIFCHDSA